MEAGFLFNSPEGAGMCCFVSSVVWYLDWTNSQSLVLPTACDVLGAGFWFAFLKLMLSWRGCTHSAHIVWGSARYWVKAVVQCCKPVLQAILSCGAMWTAVFWAVLLTIQA